jgi:hypothetical protein
MAGAPKLANEVKKLVDEFYKAPEAGLCQGDLLSCEKLKELLPPCHEKDPLKEVYPYFFTNYSHCIILNSDCDIVFENDRRPKVRCAQLAAVVDGFEYVKDILLKVSNKVHYETRLIDMRTYGKVVTKFQKLINQQEKLFYLPESSALGFNAAHVVRLDTSISIQIDTKDKYDALVKSRLPLRLNEPYKSKLGENFSNLYNRIGLTDVKDILGSEYSTWLEQEMDQYFIRVNEWAYRRSIKEVKEIAQKFDSETSEYMNQLLAVLEKHGQEPVYDFEDLPAFQSIKRIIKGRCPSIADAVLKNIQSDAVIRDALQTLLDIRTLQEDDT